MPTTRRKPRNLSCQLSPEDRRLVEDAAQRLGLTVPDFIARAVVAAASDLLRGEPTVYLTREEWERFTTALDRPPREPGEATKRAVALCNEGRDATDRRRP